MGTLALQAAAQGADVWLVSMDSDIAQLVEDGDPAAGRSPVHLWMYRPYQRDSVMYNAADVKERYGVLPEQVPDKALKGDTSDNIPGIPGVGDKTAIKLVEQFGSVEAMVEHVDEVTPPKIQGLVREYADQLRQSKQLATIVRDAPATLDLEAADFYTHYEPSRVQEFFRNMEFRTSSLACPRRRRAPRPGAEMQLTLDTERNYATVLEEHDLDRLVERIRGKGAFVLDLETSTREPMRADIVAFSIGVGEVRRTTCRSPTRRASATRRRSRSRSPWRSSRRWSRTRSVKIHGPNVKFDYVVLANNGITMRASNSTR